MEWESSTRHVQGCERASGHANSEVTQGLEKRWCGARVSLAAASQAVPDISRKDAEHGESAAPSMTAGSDGEVRHVAPPARACVPDQRQSRRETTREAKRSTSRQSGDDGRSMRGDRAEAQCSLPSGNSFAASDAQRSPSPFPALRPASSNPSATPGRKGGRNAKAVHGTLQEVPVSSDCRPDVRHHRTSSHRGGSHWPTTQVSLSGRHGKACRQSDGCPQACRRRLHAFSRPRHCGQWCRESAASGTKVRIGKEP